MNLYQFLSQASGTLGMSSGDGEYSDFILLSSLLPSLTSGSDLPISPGVKLLVDTQMQDSDRLGLVTNSGQIVFDPRVNTRLLVSGLDNYGSVAIGTNSVTPYPTDAVIDFWGAAPTVNGYTSSERTALGIGSGVVRGLTHTVNTPTGNDGFKNDSHGLSRGFINNPGGSVKLFGKGPAIRRLNAHYTSGTTLVLDAPVTAKAGATVIITPTTFFDASKRTEERVLAVDVVNSTVITITAALGFSRWGRLQYATDAGASLTADTFSTMRADVSQDPTIDERAFVCIVSSNVRIRGYDCGGVTSLSDLGFGWHGMSMGLTSETVLSGVQSIDGGQQGLLGRYGGWHFHQPSYNADGTIRTDGVPGSTPFSQTGGSGGPNYPTGKAIVTGCAFYRGHNRAMVLHACRGVTVTNNIGYKSLGHTFFEEDGSEEDNVVQNNVAIGAQPPPAGSFLKSHESQTPAGLWFANFNNDHFENWAVDCAGVGFWNAVSKGLLGYAGTDGNFNWASFAGGCLGYSYLVPIWPFFAIQGKGRWKGNSAFACAQGGESGRNPTDNQGNEGDFGLPYTTTDGQPFGQYGVGTGSTSAGVGASVLTLIENMRLFKCGTGLGNGTVEADKRPCYHNRAFRVTYLNPVSADNRGPHFQGQVQPGSQNLNAIAFKDTLNHESHVLDSNLAIWAASYHGLMQFRRASLFNFTGGTPKVTTTLRIDNTSILEAWDQYTDSIHTWSIDHDGWKILNCNGYWQTPYPAMLNDVTTYNSYNGGNQWCEDSVPPVNGIRQSGEHNRYALGIIYDHYGNLTTGPSQAGVPNSFIVWNQPFYMTGVTGVAPQGNSESRIVTTPFFGIFPQQDDSNTIEGDPDFHGHSPDMNEYPCYWQRKDTSRVDIAGARISFRPAFQTPSGLSGPDQGTFFNGYRHAAVPKDAIVLYQRQVVGSTVGGACVNADPNSRFFIAPIIYIPNSLNPYASANDAFILGIPWSGSVPPRVITDSQGIGYQGEPYGGGYSDGRGQLYSSLGSWAEMLATTSGYNWWHETSANVLWVKFRMNAGNSRTYLIVKPSTVALP